MDFQKYYVIKMDLNLKDNLIAALTTEDNEITPVGSFPATCMIELMEKEGVSWPKGHTDAEDMAKIAASAYEHVGLESMVLPFDLCFEAEALGCEVLLTDHDNSSQTTNCPFTIDDFEADPDFIHNARFPAMIEATKILQDKYDDVPIVGAMSGPITVLGQCLGIEGVLKDVNTKVNTVEDALDEMTMALTEQVELYNELGMDAIVLYEPNGAPELLAPPLFERLLNPLHEELTDASDIPMVLHVCGNSLPQLENMMSCGYQGVSIADDVNLDDAQATREKLGSDTVVCGNISVTDTLFMKSPADVKAEVTTALEKNVNVVLPACMIAPLSPAQNVRAMIEARNEYFGILFPNFIFF